MGVNTIKVICLDCVKIKGWTPRRYTLEVFPGTCEYCGKDNYCVSNYFFAENIMSDENKIRQIIREIRTRIDADGLVVIDENLGDVAETYNAILHLCTNGLEGESFGIFPKNYLTPQGDIK